MKNHRVPKKLQDEKTFKEAKEFGWILTVTVITLSAFVFVRFPKAGIPAIFLGAFVSILSIVITIKFPRFFYRADVLWRKLGVLMAKITNPIILGLIFYLVITPVAILGRILKRDLLGKPNKTQLTYWVNRSTPEYSPESFRRAF